MYMTVQFSLAVLDVFSFLKNQIHKSDTALPSQREEKTTQPQQQAMFQAELHCGTGVTMLKTLKPIVQRHLVTKFTNFFTKPKQELASTVWSHNQNLFIIGIFVHPGWKSYNSEIAVVFWLDIQLSTFT